MVQRLAYNVKLSTSFISLGPNGYVTPLPFLTAEEMITGIPNPNGRAAYNPGPAETVKEPKDEVGKNVRLYAFASCI